MWKSTTLRFLLRRGSGRLNRDNRLGRAEVEEVEETLVERGDFAGAPTPGLLPPSSGKRCAAPPALFLAVAEPSKDGEASDGADDDERRAMPATLVESRGIGLALDRAAGQGPCVEVCEIAPRSVADTVYTLLQNCFVLFLFCKLPPRVAGGGWWCRCDRRGQERHADPSW